MAGDRRAPSDEALRPRTRAERFGAGEAAHAFDRLMELGELATPFAIRAFATLGLADLIAAGTHEPGELARLAGVDGDTLERLLRHLVAIDVVEESVPNSFALTEMGELLHSDHPARLRPWFNLDGGLGHSDVSMTHLLTSLRIGGPVYEQVFGATFWEDMARRPRQRADYDALMTRQSSMIAAEVARDYDWSTVGHVVDVGGGEGELLLTLLRRHPALRGTVVELPETAARAQRRLTAAGMADRVDTRAGSFFEPLPGGDVLVLSMVLHNWPDAEATAILRRCAEAAVPGGRVLLVEMCRLTGAPPDPIITSLDLRMLVSLGGRERTVGELDVLADEAGLTVQTATLLRSGRTLVSCGLRTALG